MKLEQLGIGIPERTLRYWESEGILPSPTIEKDGLPGYYPWWFVDLVWLLRRLQLEGEPLSAIGEQLRYRASWLTSSYLSRLYINYGGEARVVHLAKTVFMEEHHPDRLPLKEPAEELALWLQAQAPIFAEIAHTVASAYGKRVGHSVVEVNLQIKTDDGQALAIPLVDTLTAQERKPLSGSQP